jgi:hypothetical protein
VLHVDRPRGLEPGGFVFHDRGGRRWCRIKRVMLLLAILVGAVGGAVLLALANVAPGRAPFFATNVPQPIQDWPIRDPGGGASTPAAGSTASTRAAGSVLPAWAQASPVPQSAGVGSASPGPSSRHSPRSSPRPKPSRPPVPATSSL